MRNQFADRLNSLASVNEVRGRGLMIGIELTVPCADLVQKALDNRILINVTADKVIRLLPPLILSDQEADMIVDSVASLVEAFDAAQAA